MLQNRANSINAHLCPARTLLEAIPDFLRGFTNGQVLLHVAALPLALCELHAQGVILCQGVLWRPAALLKGVRADQEIGTCNGTAQSESTGTSFMLQTMDHRSKVV